MMENEDRVMCEGYEESVRREEVVEAGQPQKAAERPSDSSSEVLHKQAQIQSDRQGADETEDRPLILEDQRLEKGQRRHSIP